MAQTVSSAGNELKKALGEAAAALIKEGMKVGLGTGSTAVCFIDALIRRCQQGLHITAVATSEASARQARQGGIPVVDINEAIRLDITVDGADEIDDKKRMIKGGGGALLREKIVAASSKEMVVIVEERKCVKRLGAFPLPIEVVSFGYKATLEKLSKLGDARLRMTGKQEIFVTDNGNYTVDIHFKKPLEHPEELHQNIRDIPGVVDTGFFFGLAGRVLIARTDGKVEVLS